MTANFVLPGAEDKRKALRRVLESDTFARADQLKQFLAYVCEMEILGRSHEITEYRIGLEALGKPEDFSPVQDASVRNRAYALRKKLEKLYAEEDPDAPVRIEFVKGTYIPRFVENGSPVEPVAPLEPEVRHGRAPSWMRRFGLPLVMLLVGIGIGAAAMAVSGRPMAVRASDVNPIVREAWGPLLDRREEILISLATPAQMTVLPYDIKMEWMPEIPKFEAPPGLYPWYLRYHRLFSSHRLYMIPDVNSPHFGDVLGASMASRLLTSAGCAYKLLPERVVPTALLQSRNAILFGVPYKSEAVLKLFENTKFRFTYDPKLRDVVITEAQDGGKPPKIYASKRDERDDRVGSFGLITVLPRDLGNGKSGRVIAFSGDPSAGAAAAVAFFSSPKHLADFRQRLHSEGYQHWPAAYQILVKCNLDSNLPSDATYAGHSVLSAR